MGGWVHGWVGWGAGRTPVIGQNACMWVRCDPACRRACCLLLGAGRGPVDVGRGAGSRWGLCKEAYAKAPASKQCGSTWGARVGRLLVCVRPNTCIGQGPGRALNRAALPPASPNCR